MKVYVLQKVSRKNNYEVVIGVFDHPKTARKYHDEFFNHGESTKNKWKKCPSKSRRYEQNEGWQFFITEFRVEKDKDYVLGE